jgi:hypothetical protein
MDEELESFCSMISAASPDSPWWAASARSRRAWNVSSDRVTLIRREPGAQPAVVPWRFDARCVVLVISDLFGVVSFTGNVVDP